MIGLENHHWMGEVWWGPRYLHGFEVSLHKFLIIKGKMITVEKLNQFNPNQWGKVTSLTSLTLGQTDITCQLIGCTEKGKTSLLWYFLQKA